MFALAALPATLRTALLAGVAALIVGLAGWGWWQHAAAASARQEAAQALAAVASRDSALAELQAMHARQVAALERQATDAAARTARLAPTRRNVDASPATSACSASPAVAAALAGLRRPAANGAGGADAGAGVPAGVPAAAGTARRG